MVKLGNGNFVNFPEKSSELKILIRHGAEKLRKIRIALFFLLFYGKVKCGCVLGDIFLCEPSKRIPFFKNK